MNREEYRRAIDQLSFSADFQERTAALLQTRARELEKEKPNMHFKKTRKLAVLAAAAVAVLAVSVSAAVLWLSPSQVAERFEDPILAAAFQSEDAVLVNETAQAGDYDITLMGLVSGEGIRKWYDEAEPSRTYAVVSAARADGTPLSSENYDVMPSGTFTISPLVAGYSPMAVNAWTLDGSCASFLEGGVAYYLLDTLDIQMFADRTVYLAVYEGFVPSYNEFSVAEDGTYSLRDGVTGALFTLPLDESLADPAAARAFVEGTGMNYVPMTDGERAALAEEEEAPLDLEAAYANGTYLGETVKLIEVEGHGIVTEMQAQAATQYEAYMKEETARMAREVEDGTLSQENCDKTVQEMEEVLAGIWDGTMVAYPITNADGTISMYTGMTGAAAAEQGYDLEQTVGEDGTVGITIKDAG